MRVLSLTTKEFHYLVIIIEPANLARMKTGDPITVNSREFGGVIDLRPGQNLQVLVAYEEDVVVLDELIARTNSEGVAPLLERLMRGYKFIDGLDGAPPEHQAQGPEHT